MQDNSLSRRNVFQILGVAAAAATPTLAEPHAHVHAAAQPEKTGSYKRQTFDEHQWRTVRVLCDLIIPADEDGPSASAAEVPEFIDDWLAYRAVQDGNLDLTAKIFGGLMWLDREAREKHANSFVDLSAGKQKILLDRIAYPASAAENDKPYAAFFSEMRNLTVGGYFSSKAGVAYLPYLGNTLVTEWNGCDPKVWAIIEDRMRNGYRGIINKT